MTVEAQIEEALLSFLSEGVEEVTADEVAERAGIRHHTVVGNALWWKQDADGVPEDRRFERVGVDTPRNEYGQHVYRLWRRDAE
jgi:hypothetical protein